MYQACGRQMDMLRGLNSITHKISVPTASEQVDDLRLDDRVKNAHDEPQMENASNAFPTVYSIRVNSPVAGSSNQDVSMNNREWDVHSVECAAAEPLQDTTTANTTPQSSETTDQQAFDRDDDINMS
ncbi:uncharacterized protein RCC_12182 [Ramularia collo-cygni]|uniref:Uncharacterized protein n=1 Tax=Ramularia collo-cygni TaxID=112498 RepID=A0A2D3VBJ7_9PEZI|nr:uncharacterized protein RCC_12182 [Ramularia collo-cygni]CZT23045.1 uncharacterized protein RCC_12182 [Ramularia collo-cygni]